ncbi:TIGR03089 family protein [Pseudarthrobacter sp. J75]|uniref:TIGR03089 family protein n=1 Tax=unclassified Pseudarthrobacter TaxID=2647000 RepID=UPI002E81CE50|nr:MULTISPECIES: TIGR03089 family protein [unclassified Pseudarthrobacter]MEE2521632.1 TIGR03089 family protein [Pseudarthrobacter sp. J47]MEE2527709.1 TIGR03089 family protein [Pseudarthrobacter sp. J75]
MSNPDSALPASLLLALLRSGHSSSPRLTWYGPEGERVELSGRVLDNWVAKTSNLLQDELDAEPGQRLLVDIPAHWKSVVWSLAGWQLGMEVVIPDGGTLPVADVAVTADPATAPDAPAVVAVALPALAMKWTGELPRGVIDFASEVRSHGDVFMAHSDADPAAAALHTGTAAYSHGELVEGFGEPQTEGVRLLVRAGDGLGPALAKALGAWEADGSVVLVHPDVAVTEKLLAAERVTDAGAHQAD